jgi:CII-binding regulator of phage lambda lysogenization HflD
MEAAAPRSSDKMTGFPSQRGALVCAYNFCDLVTDTLKAARKLAHEHTEENLQSLLAKFQELANNTKNLDVKSGSEDLLNVGLLLEDLESLLDNYNQNPSDFRSSMLALMNRLDKLSTELALSDDHTTICSKS